MNAILDRRQVVLGISAALITAGVQAESPINAPWLTVPPGRAGLAADLEARLDTLIAEKRAWGLHGVLVVRGRRIVLERYFAGKENNWGALRDVRFGPDTLHNLYSATKSIVGLLYCVALTQGKVPPPSAPLYAQFPEYADLVEADPRRQERTIAHALSMTLGLQWDEVSVPYADLANDEIGMEHARDRYRFILERPVVGPPGRRWLYSGGATALVARIIAKGVGRPFPDYAREALFDPLGIGPTEWLANKDTWVAAKYGPGDGEPVAASGLRMTARDLARVGQLIIDNGVAGGRRLVSADLLAEMLKPRVAADENRRYGYQWYMGDMEFRAAKGVGLEHWVGAFGNGGQRLFVWPELDLIVVTTAGNYGAPDQWIPPMRVVREVVLPGITPSDP